MIGTSIWPSPSKSKIFTNYFWLLILTGDVAIGTGNPNSSSKSSIFWESLLLTLLFLPLLSVLLTYIGFIYWVFIGDGYIDILGISFYDFLGLIPYIFSCKNYFYF